MDNLDKKNIFKNIKKDNMVYLYRSIFAAVTCFFYSAFTDVRIIKKSYVVLMITVFSAILIYLYYNCRGNRKYILFLLFLETFYTCVIIVLTGGLNSPFIWLVFNSILIFIMVFNSLILSLVCLLIYIFFSMITPYILPYIFKNIVVENIFNYNTLLCLIFITLLLYIIYDSKNTIYMKNLELNKANIQIKKTVNQIIELYNTMHTFTNQDNKNDIIKEVLNFSALIFKTEDVIFCAKEKKQFSDVTFYKYNEFLCDPVLENYLKENYDMLILNKSVKKFDLNKISYLFCTILHNLNIFGLIALAVKDEEIIYNTLLFISDLAAIVLKGINLKKINNDLIINEEQNRIADDIHDSVLQRLFSISCQVYALIKKTENCNSKMTKSELNNIRNDINISMMDLRKIVYNLSEKKYGENMFIKEIEDYINEVIEYHNIAINFEFTGDSELLSVRQKNLIYRILCELISNAIRHGKAKRIDIKFMIINNIINLVVKDYGTGFNYKKILEESKEGLGLKNISHCVNLLSGVFDIDSIYNKGTIISIEVPISSLTNRYETRGEI